MTGNIITNILYGCIRKIRIMMNHKNKRILKACGKHLSHRTSVLVLKILHLNVQQLRRLGYPRTIPLSTSLINVALVKIMMPLKLLVFFIKDKFHTFWS